MPLEKLKGMLWLPRVDKRFKRIDHKEVSSKLPIIWKIQKVEKIVWMQNKLWVIVAQLGSTPMDLHQLKRSPSIKMAIRCIHKTLPNLHGKMEVWLGWLPSNRKVYRRYHHRDILPLVWTPTSASLVLTTPWNKNNNRSCNMAHRWTALIMWIQPDCYQRIKISFSRKVTSWIITDGTDLRE